MTLSAAIVQKKAACRLDKHVNCLGGEFCYVKPQEPQEVSKNNPTVCAECTEIDKLMS